MTHLNTASSAGASGITIGTTTITSGTNTRVLFDDSGVVGEDGGLSYTKGTVTLALGKAGVNGVLTLMNTGGNTIGKFDTAAGQLAVFSDGSIGFSNANSNVTTIDTSLYRAAANVLTIGTTGFAGTGWLQQSAGRSRVNGDVTNATNTLAAITGLSSSLKAGRKYTGEMVLKCSNSTAAEGIAVTFDGGAATMTSFAAGAGILTGGTTVTVNAVSSALATAFDWSTITGETWITFRITMVVNAAGTFIPRFRESTAHTSGTATVSLGSYMWLEDTP